MNETAMELKPCPFCGTVELATAVYGERRPHLGLRMWRMAWFVICERCGTEGPPSIKRSVAIDNWNNREATA